jgi:homoserine trans-succinylase
MTIKGNALHIAIDLGTAFSGFASSMQNANQQEVTLTVTYPDKPSGYEYCKQPSRLLYRKLVPNPTRREHYDFIATGFTVDMTLLRVSTFAQLAHLMDFLDESLTSCRICWVADSAVHLHVWILGSWA